MKRIISLILTLCLVLGLAACGGTSPSQSSSAEAPASSSAESTPAGSTEESAPESSGPAETYELIAEQTDLDQIAVSSEHFSFTKGELAYYYAMVYRETA